MLTVTAPLILILSWVEKRRLNKYCYCRNQLLGTWISDRSTLCPVGSQSNPKGRIQACALEALNRLGRHKRAPKRDVEPLLSRAAHAWALLWHDHVERLLSRVPCSTRVCAGRVQSMDTDAHGHGHARE